MSEPVFKALFTLVWELIVLAIGMVCMFWPDRVQRYALDYYDRHPMLAWWNPFLFYIKTREYIIFLRIVGGVALFMAFVGAWALVKSIFQ